MLLKKSEKEPTMAAKLLTLVNWVQKKMGNPKTARVKIVATLYDKNSREFNRREIWIGRTMGLSGDAKATASVRKRG